MANAITTLKSKAYTHHHLVEWLGKSFSTIIVTHRYVNSHIGDSRSAMNTAKVCAVPVAATIAHQHLGCCLYSIGAMWHQHCVQQCYSFLMICIYSVILLALRRCYNYSQDDNEKCITSIHIFLQPRHK